MTTETKEKERPILFSGPMVRAILEGRKTQTRRVVKWPAWIQEHHKATLSVMKPATGLGLFKDGNIQKRFMCPYGPPGDQLWVRETFCIENGGNDYLAEIPKDGRPYKEEDIEGDFPVRLIPHYRATEPEPNIVPFDVQDEDGSDDRTRWKPCIFMPRWASRIQLEITNVRVEHLQDISEADAKAEGANLGEATNFEGPAPVTSKTHRTGFFHLWDKINGLASWNANPYVWVVEFKVVKP